MLKNDKYLEFYYRIKSTNNYNVRISNAVIDVYFVDINIAVAEDLDVGAVGMKIRRLFVDIAALVVKINLSNSI